MNLQDYRDQNQKVKPNASIKERWQKRVVTRGLSGAEGARQYLSDYGRGIGAKKVLMLARQAELSGDIPMSEIFYAKAHELEFGEPATGSLTASATPAAIPVMTVQKEISLEGLPEVMQPGKIVTAQPVDARHDRDYYINSPHYFGQAKIDGQKALAFVTASRVVYQSRSMRVRETPSVEMDRALMITASKVGPFILEGEVTYLDLEGGEHRTGAQAATYNIDHGAPRVQPEMKFYVFDCLYFKRDIRREGKETRLWEAETLCLYIQNVFDDVVMINTARTGEEKKRLVQLQLTEGREGEVWFYAHAPYSPGKPTDGSFVRTKYLQEFEANITNVFPATAEGHTIGGFEITDDRGKVLGNVGTGYSRSDQEEILARFQAGNARAKIRCQGFTEKGFVWHGRFIGWA